MTRVLVVEDEESYSDALAYMLRKEGFDVSVANTGPDALAEFDKTGADIVLLDLMLPGIPGTEVCRQIRQTSNVPVIMVSAKDAEVDKVVGLGAAPQHSADPGDELAGRVRLGDVVVGPELEADDLVHLVVLGADHDHRDVRHGADLAAHLRAGQARQHQVEEHDVGTVAVELRQRVRPGGGQGHVVPLLAEQVGQSVGVALLVLDDEHAGHRSGPVVWVVMRSPPGATAGATG